jgi:hypothetical protein
VPNPCPTIRFNSLAQQRAAYTAYPQLIPSIVTALKIIFLRLLCGEQTGHLVSKRTIQAFIWKKSADD